METQGPTHREKQELTGLRAASKKRPSAPFPGISFDLELGADGTARVLDIGPLPDPAAESAGLDLLFYYDPELPLEFLADNARLKQILYNLVGNAVKFTPRRIYHG